MSKPFIAAIQAANRVIAESGRFSRSDERQRVTVGRDLEEACDILSAALSRQIAVGLPPCKASYPDGTTGWEEDVRQALKALGAAADKLAEAAKSFPLPIQFSSGHSATHQLAKRSEFESDLRDLEQRLKERIQQLVRLQREVNTEPVPTAPQTPAAPPAPDPMVPTDKMIDVTGLNRTQAAVLRILAALPPGEGITGKEIVARLKGQKIVIGQPYLRKHVMPKLKESHGVDNHRGAGGYLIPPELPPA